MASIYDGESKVNKKGTKTVPFGQAAGLKAVPDTGSDTISITVANTVLTVLTCGVQGQSNFLGNRQASTNTNQGSVTVVTSLVVEIGSTGLDCNSYRTYSSNINGAN